MNTFKQLINAFTELSQTWCEGRIAINKFEDVSEYFLVSVIFSFHALALYIFLRWQEFGYLLP